MNIPELLFKAVLFETVLLLLGEKRAIPKLKLELFVVLLVKALPSEADMIMLPFQFELAALFCKVL